jgi:hypothetical protein
MFLGFFTRFQTNMAPSRDNIFCGFRPDFSGEKNNHQKYQMPERWGETNGAKHALPKKTGVGDVCFVQ